MVTEPSRAPITVSLIEDDVDTGEAFCAGVAASRTCELGCWFTRFQPAIENLLNDHPDVVFVDLELPDGRGVDVIRHFYRNSDKPDFVVYTNYSHDEYVFDAFCAGANGYLLKHDAEPESIDDCIAMILRGESPMSGAIARRCIQYFHPTDQHPLRDVLTPKEFQVLELLADGHSVDDVSKILGISGNTVRPHCRKIYEKLRVSNRVRAVRLFYLMRVQKLFEKIKRKTKPGSD